MTVSEHFSRSPGAERRGTRFETALSPEARRLLVFLAVLAFVRGALPLVTHDRLVRLPVVPLAPWNYALTPFALVAGFVVLSLLRARPLLVLGLGVLGQGIGRGLQTVAATHAGYLAASALEATGYALFAMASYTLLTERVPRERLLLGPLAFVAGGAIGSCLGLVATPIVARLGSGDQRSLMGASLIAALALGTVALRGDRREAEARGDRSEPWWAAFTPIATPVESGSTPKVSYTAPPVDAPSVHPLPRPVALRLVLLAVLLTVGVELLRLSTLPTGLPPSEGWIAWRSTWVLAAQILPFALLAGLAAGRRGLGRAIRAYGFVLVAVIAIGWVGVPIRGLAASGGSTLVATAIGLVVLRILLAVEDRRRMVTAYAVHAVVAVANMGLWWVLAPTTFPPRERAAYPIGLTVALVALLAGVLTILLLSPAPAEGSDDHASPVPLAT